MDNWIKDITFATPDCPFPGAPDGAKVHLGFLQSWEYMKPEVTEAILVLVNQYPNSKLLINGHSLGGAIATLCSIDLVTSYPNLVFIIN